MARDRRVFELCSNVRSAPQSTRLLQKCQQIIRERRREQWRDVIFCSFLLSEERESLLKRD
jgi:hypothetical protein